MPGNSQALLNAISFGVEPGQTCGVIGSSGSGKTTLCRLIVGTMRPSLGHVRLDGAEVWNWPSDELGQHIGYLPQQVELFPGTIAENIARLRDVDSEAVIAAAQLAGIHEMILRLPNGYRTEVGPHGARISRGQRQRIALARRSARRAGRPAQAHSGAVGNTGQDCRQCGREPEGGGVSHERAIWRFLNNAGRTGGQPARAGRQLGRFRRRSDRRGIDLVRRAEPADASRHDGGSRRACTVADLAAVSPALARPRSQQARPQSTDQARA
ncbi:MAG: ATP-binding cassette domain-containing protein, partial [Mesorhizobium sp.]